MTYAQYAPVARAAAEAYGIDPAIFERQIMQESGFRTGLTSSAGAQGIAQFMPATAAGMGIDPNDPNEALYAAAALMAENLSMFGGDYAKALAAYNAGPGAVQQYGGVPPYEETQRYVSTILGEEGSMPEQQTVRIEDVGPALEAAGWRPVTSRPDDPSTWGGKAIWEKEVQYAGSDKPETVRRSEFDLAEEFWGEASPYATPKAGSAAAAGTLKVNPQTGTWWQITATGARDTGVPAEQDPSSPSAGFSLSPGQTRYGPDGRVIAASPSSGSQPDAFTLGQNQVRYVPDATAPGGYRALYGPSEADDPTAMLKIQNEQADLAYKYASLQFLQDKHKFEMESGLRKEAADTQKLIFDQQAEIARDKFVIDQANLLANERRETRLQDLATDIGTLAQDPGDRAKYASTVLANSSLGFGQDKAQSGLITDDSLAPLESLLRTREQAMQPITPFSYQGPQVPSGINLGALTPQAAAPGAAPQMPGVAPVAPYAPPATMPGFDPNANGGVDLNAQEIMAGAQYPNPPPAGIDLAGLTAQQLPQSISREQYEALKNQALPLKAGGGIEDGAYISGEAGPEINIPLPDGKTAILNEQQAASMGINLSKLTKMASGGIFDVVAANIKAPAPSPYKFSGGGIFDGLANDDGDRAMATDFLSQASARAVSGTPWAGQTGIPGPTFGSSPGFDPLVLQLMASINAMQTGLPASAYMRNAQMRTPAGVNESPVRRTA